MIEKQMAKFGQHLSPEELDKAVQRAEKPGPVLRGFSVVTGLVFQTLIYLVPAALFWIFFKLAGSELTFKSSLLDLPPLGGPGGGRASCSASRSSSVAPHDPARGREVTGRLLARAHRSSWPRRGASMALRGALSALRRLQPLVGRARRRRLPDRRPGLDHRRRRPPRSSSGCLDRAPGGCGRSSVG